MKPTAVCSIIENLFDQYLSVYWDKRGYGFPGGLIDEGETVFEAGVREIEEETGLILPMYNFVRLGEQKAGQHVTCLLFYKIPVFEKVRSSDEGETLWANREKFLIESKFKVWNKWAFAQLDSWKSRNA